MDRARRRRLRHRLQLDISLSSDRAMILGQRELLSGGLAGDIRAVHAAHHHVRPVPHSGHHAAASPSSKRVGPAREIKEQYAQFLAAFRVVEQSYVSTLNQPTNNLIAVSTSVTAPYTSGSSYVQVADAAVFGPVGTTYPSDVIATALIGSTPVGTLALSGSYGNLVAVDLTNSNTQPISLNTGAVLTANVTVTAQTSAAAIFPSYISASTRQMGATLVKYFNNLPIPLPRKYAPLHEDPQTGAIQQFVYQEIASNTANSLMQVLLAIPLPTTPGGDLQIYDSSVNTAVATSELSVLDGVKQIFAGKGQVVPISPSSTTSGSTTTSGTSSSGSTSGTSSTG